MSRRPVSEVAGFIDMLHAACEDSDMRTTLERLLTQTDLQRQRIIDLILDELRRKEAPARLVEAIACLRDDAIAEQAHQVLFRCHGE